MMAAFRTSPAIFVLTLFLSSCDSNDATLQDLPQEEVSENCIISTREFANSTGIDAIPALTDPDLVGAADIGYLNDSDLVLGVRTGDLTLAIPHNILWWHEIVNLNTTTPQLAITFCPLTGSGLTFERGTVNNLEFGVSGLLWRNNNVMFERSDDTFSLWSQMGRVALCNSEGNAGKTLDLFPTIEMTWGGWKTLYPDTKVLSAETGFNRKYSINPLGNYTEPANTELFWPMPGVPDRRRLPKERILGLPVEKGGLSFPLQELDKLGAKAALRTMYKDEAVTIFYDREKSAAWAFWLTDENDRYNFNIADGKIQDTATGSIWQIDGLAIEGPLAGTRLAPVDEAYVSYWFAWSVFQPEATLWEANE